MTVPTKIPFSQIPNAGVFSPDTVRWFIKCDPNTYCDLSSGAVTTPADPNALNMYFPGAALVIN